MQGMRQKIAPNNLARRDDERLSKFTTPVYIVRQGSGTKDMLSEGKRIVYILKKTCFGQEGNFKHDQYQECLSQIAARETSEEKQGIRPSQEAIFHLQRNNHVCAESNSSSYLSL